MAIRYKVGLVSKIIDQHPRDFEYEQARKRELQRATKRRPWLLISWAIVIFLTAFLGALLALVAIMYGM